MPPMILGSIKFLITVIIRYSTTRPEASRILPVRAQNTAHGISTVPQPSTGKISITAITAAVKSAYLRRRMRKPKNSSENVISIISRYPRIILRKFFSMTSFAKRRFSAVLSGRRFVRYEHISS